MNYYFDTEFIEGTQKKTFLGINVGETKPTIDLISIGIVAEDGREYYAISKDFNLKEAWNRYDIKIHEQTCLNKNGENGDYCYYVYLNDDVDLWKREFKGYKTLYNKGDEYKEYWIRENVLRPIFDEWKMDLNRKIVRLGLPTPLNEMIFNYKNFKYCIECIGKSNKLIAKEIYHYINPEILTPNLSRAKGWKNDSKPKFYAYFADYDWVAFCWLFGKMMDLPNGFPKYCIDLKQILDSMPDQINLWNSMVGANKDKKCTLEMIKKDKQYPKQENEHNALDDARWNKKLHEFIKKL